MSTACPRCGTAAKPGQPSCAACGQMFGPAAGKVPAPQPRPAQRRALMTELASQAFDLSDTFNLMFERQFVGHKVELGKPGMSTAGGKQAVQHIVLHATDGASLVVGSVDAGVQQAGLRPYERVRAAYRQRFGSSLPIPASAWHEFVGKAEGFFREEGLEIRREPLSGEAFMSGAGVLAASSARRGVPLWLALLLAAVLASIAVGVTIFVLRRDPAPAVPVGPVPGAWPGPVPSPVPATP